MTNRLSKLIISYTIPNKAIDVTDLGRESTILQISTREDGAIEVVFERTRCASVHHYTTVRICTALLRVLYLETATSPSQV